MTIRVSLFTAAAALLLSTTPARAQSTDEIRAARAASAPASKAQQVAPKLAGVSTTYDEIRAAAAAARASSADTSRVISTNLATSTDEARGVCSRAHEREVAMKLARK